MHLLKLLRRSIQSSLEYLVRNALEARAWWEISPVRLFFAENKGDFSVRWEMT
jgi:hypothetical protein